MTPDELRPILAGYRKTVEPAWSQATGHPLFPSTAGSAVGQCGVTSVWLQERLLEDHGIESVFCGGSVYVNHRVVEVHHCWLEVGEMVIDLTADQIEGFVAEVVCEPNYQLLRNEIAYAGQDSRRAPELLHRLALLKAAL